MTVPRRAVSPQRGAIPALLAAGILAAGAVAEQPTPELAVQSGHVAEVTCLALTPDGLVLAAGEYHNRRLTFWDLRSSRQVRTLAATPLDLVSLAYATGDRLAAMTDGTTVHLLDGHSGAELRSLRGPTSPNATVVHAQGRVVRAGDLIAAGVPQPGQSDSWAVQLWTPEGEPAGTLTGPAGDRKARDITALAVTRDGRRLFVGWDGGWVDAWNLGTRTTSWSKQLATKFRTDTVRQGIADLDVNPDGTRLAVTTATSVEVLDTGSGATLRTLALRQAPFTEAEFTEDGAQVAVGGEEGELLWWRWSEQGAQPRPMPLPAGRVNAIVRVPGRLLAVAVGPRIAFVSPDASAPARVLGGVREGEVVDFTWLGPRHLATASDSTVDLWDLQRARHGGTITGLRGAPRALRASRDGSRLLVHSGAGAEEGVLSAVEVKTGHLDWTLPMRPHAAEARLSPDGTLVTVGRGGRLLVFEARTGSVVNEVAAVTPDRAASQDPGGVAVVDFLTTRDGKLSLITVGPTRGGDPPDRIDLWSSTVEGPQAVVGVGDLGPIVVMEVSPDGGYVAVAHPDSGRVVMFDFANWQPRQLDSGGRSLAFSPDGTLLATGDDAGAVTLWRTGDGVRLSTYEAGVGPVRRLAFRPDGKVLASLVVGSGIQLWDVPATRLFAHAFLRRDSGLFVLADGHYMGSRDTMDAVAFRVGPRAYPFDQFDLRYNRPDLVLEALGHFDAALSAALRSAWKRRLRRVGVDEAQLVRFGTGPELVVITPPPVATENRQVGVRVRARSNGAPLRRLLVSINGVPAAGPRGTEIPAAGREVFEREIPLELNVGPNRIQLWVVDASGVESLRETLEVACSVPAGPPTVYVLAVGVTRYRDAARNLTYAAKDAEDLATFFRGRATSYGGVQTLVLADERATAERIRTTRFLERAGLDDVVIVFVAGHGVLDADLDYRFACHDTNFADVSGTGLSLDDLEALIANVRARKRLLLIDSCHSGELDEEGASAPAATAAAPLGAEVRALASRGARPLAGRTPHRSADVARELFTDLRRGTGAVVVSAAGGAEFAYEGRQWRNGVFTYAVLQALGEWRADANADGRLTVSELREWVTREVARLTGGRQVPTARRENIDFDFTLAERKPPSRDRDAK